MRKTVIQPDEMLVDISFPAMSASARGMFLKLALRRAQAISIVNVAVILDLAGDTVKSASITLGAVTPVIIHAEEAEKYLVGKQLGDEVFEEAARLAMAASRPIDDIRGSAAYRREMIRVCTLRGLRAIHAKAPENTPEVFLVFCGVLALGRLIAAGERQQFKRLRPYASDPRWRIREAAAMALQTVGDADTELLVREATRWSRGNWYEKRAAAAGLAEPRLLISRSTTAALLEMLDSITASMARAKDRKSEAFRTLRQGMGYCWSVAVAAYPSLGKRLMQKWLKKADPDVRWMMRENLKKNRLAKMDTAWVKSCVAALKT